MILVDMQTDSAQQTLQLGRALGGLLPAGALVLLQGELGAGKTCLASGIARGLGVDASVPITSPTYTLLNCYEGVRPFYHFDLYRLATEEELEELGFDEYFHGDGVAVVEWPERCPGLERSALTVELSYLDEQRRRIVISAAEPFAETFDRCCEEIRHLSQK